MYDRIYKQVFENREARKWIWYLDIVLLMDDITTSGNSLYACKNILIESGADTVEMFALGKTVRD